MGVELSISSVDLAETSAAISAICRRLRFIDAPRNRHDGSRTGRKEILWPSRIANAMPNTARSNGIPVCHEVRSRNHPTVVTVALVIVFENWQLSSPGNFMLPGNNTGAKRKWLVKQPLSVSMRQARVLGQLCRLEHGGDSQGGRFHSQSSRTKTHKARVSSPSQRDFLAGEPAFRTDRHNNVLV